ncbi:MAG: lectin-like protein [Planctomycetota bacterium]
MAPTYLGDTWEWDGANWLQRSPSASPPARWGHALAWDGNRGGVVAFGGTSQPYASSSVRNDTWQYDGVTWTPVASAITPPARMRIEYSMDFDESRQSVLLFGGRAGDVAPQDFPMSDTWELTASGWRPVLSFVPSPVNGHRYALTPPMSWPQAEALAVTYGGHLATVRNAAEHSWLWSTFGGQNSSPWIGLNDRAVEGQWVWSSGELESYRNWSPAEPNGGNNEDCAHMWFTQAGFWNDTNELGFFPGIIELPGGPTAPFTATALPTSAPPPPLAATALAPLPTGGAVLFGGATAGGPQPFTYTLGNGAFTPQFPFPQPAFRSEHALVLDPARGNNVLFGGRNPLGAALNDTWTWANGQWTARQPATAPSPRTRHRLAFAATTQTVELFGGVDAAGADLGDHWQWNGATWTQRTPTTLPQARRDHGLAFDARRQRLVLHGGASGASVRDDVWEWDGATWAQAVPQQPGGLAWAPTARTGHAFAYDPRAERVLLHGGADAAGACTADAWTWDGAAWTRHTPTSQAPSARRGGTLFFDAAANELRLFAGACGTGFANDLWSLQLPVFARAEAYGAACVGSLGAPGLALLPPSSPVVGTTMDLRISNVPGLFVPAIGAMGVSRTSWLGLPLPFELTPAGIPGCQLHQSAEVTLALTAPNGTGLVPWPIAIPTSPQLVGAEIFLQALTIELPGFPRWSSLSNGLAIRIGSQ